MIRVPQFLKAIAEFIADGCTTVTAEQYSERLKICDTCVDRSGAKCVICGCKLWIKAKGHAWDCPHPAGSRWPEIPESVATDDPASVG